MVFGGEMPEFEDREEAELVLGGLLALYNVINEDVREFGGKLPSQVNRRTPGGMLDTRLVLCGSLKKYKKCCGWPARA